MAISVGQNVFWKGKKVKGEPTPVVSGVVKAIYYVPDDHWLQSLVGVIDNDQAFLFVHEGPGHAPVVKTVSEVSETAPE